MFKNKAHPVKILSIVSIFMIIMFMAVLASGFRGVLPGSMLFSNKQDNGYYVFHRLLAELGYDVKFEKRYKTPKKKLSTIVYAAGSKENFPSEDYIEWLKAGNTLVLIGESCSLLLEENAIEDGENLPLEEAGKNSEKLPVELGITVSSCFSNEKIKNLHGLEILYKTTEGPVIVKSTIGSGHVIFISDSELFNNKNMHEIKNALLLDGLFSSLKGQPIYMREQSSEAVYDVSLIGGLFNGAGGYIILQLVILLLLGVILMGKRFARPEILEAIERRKMTEHVKAVGLFFQRANAWQLIESIDANYFKTIICRNKKPSDITTEDFLEYGSVKENIGEDDVVQRFNERQLLKHRIRERREYESGKNRKSRN
ncbi:MAG: DUF4350 domain-containing protein [Spirochaetales bacterium]|nr:DUF4350 domain-containing protein [Spirochaetales bacterium]